MRLWREGGLNDYIIEENKDVRNTLLLKRGSVYCAQFIKSNCHIAISKRKPTIQASDTAWQEFAVSKQIYSHPPTHPASTHAKPPTPPPSVSP